MNKEIPDGEYDLVVESATVKETRSELQYIGIWLLIDSGPFKGTKVSHVAKPSSFIYRKQIEPILNGLVETCGLMTVSIDMIALLMFDRRFRATVKTDFHDGRQYRRLVV